MQDYRAQILNPCARRIFSPCFKIKLCEYSPPLLLASKSISAAASLFSHSTQNPRILLRAPLCYELKPHAFDRKASLTFR